MKKAMIRRGEFAFFDAGQQETELRVLDVRQAGTRQNSHVAMRSTEDPRQKHRNKVLAVIHLDLVVALETDKTLGWSVG
jgi:hypothetical protein